MHIEKNVARIEHNVDDYRIVVTVERRNAAAITPEETEILLTKQLPFLFKL